MRLCANTGSRLHLIHPLGFELDDKRLRRAGLDYRDWAEVSEHADLQAFKAEVRPNRLLACSTKASLTYSEVSFEPGDAILFGPETRGLPESVMSDGTTDLNLRIPMVKNSRSLNLSNAVAIVLFEAWRQWGFEGGS